MHLFVLNIFINLIFAFGVIVDKKYTRAHKNESYYETYI